MIFSGLLGGLHGGIISERKEFERGSQLSKKAGIWKSFRNSELEQEYSVVFWACTEGGTKTKRKNVTKEYEL